MKPKFKISEKVNVNTRGYSTTGTIISVEIVEYMGKEHYSYGVMDEFGSSPYLEKHLTHCLNSA